MIVISWCLVRKMINIQHLFSKYFGIVASQNVLFWNKNAPGRKLRKMDDPVFLIIFLAYSCWPSFCVEEKTTFFSCYLSCWFHIHFSQKIWEGVYSSSSLPCIYQFIYRQKRKRSCIMLLIPTTLQNTDTNNNMWNIIVCKQKRT